jgi:hypothetical protein
MAASEDRAFAFRFGDQRYPPVVRNNSIGRSCRICPPILVMQASKDRFGNHS